MEVLEKGKSIGETSNLLTIEKLAETMPKIPKGVFKKTLHNPPKREISNLVGKRKRGIKVRETKTSQSPQTMLMGAKNRRKR